MFGLSFTKILVLGLAIYGAWQLFRWIERRSANQVAPPAKPPEAPTDENDGAVEMEQDPNTGVWRPKRRD